MTPLENDLTQTLREHHAGAAVPLSPSAELVELGEAAVRRRRRRTALIAAAVLVPVIGVAPWVVSQGRDANGGVDPTHAPSHLPTPAPSPKVLTSQQAQAALDALPQSVAPQVPYLLDHVLHYLDLVLPTPATAMVAASGTALVEKYSDTDATWWVLADTRLVEVPELRGVRGPRISPTGNLVAWTTYPSAGTTRVVAWDPQSRHEVDHVDLPFGEATCCGGGQPVELRGIDNQGNVYWEQADGSPTQVWRPGSGAGPHDLTGIGKGTPGRDAFAGLAPRGPVVNLASGGAAVGEVDDGGRWVQLTVLTDAYSPSLWSAEGGRYAYTGTSYRYGGGNRVEVPTVWVEDPESGQSVSIALPSGTHAQLLGFEGSEDGSLAVLVDAWVSPRKHVVLRCDSETRQCVRALTPPAGTDVGFGGTA